MLAGPFIERLDWAATGIGAVRALGVQALNELNDAVTGCVGE